MTRKFSDARADRELATRPFANDTWVVKVNAACSKVGACPAALTVTSGGIHTATRPQTQVVPSALPVGGRARAGFSPAWLRAGDDGARRGVRFPDLLANIAAGEQVLTEVGHRAAPTSAARMSICRARAHTL